MRSPHTAVKSSPYSLKQRKPVQKQQIQHCQKKKKLNDIREKTHEQNELLMKDTENIKKGQTKILELKNSVNELKNEIASVVKQREDRIN